MKKYYKIADLIVEMDSFGRTESQAAPYRIENSDRPDIVIQSHWNEVKHKHPNLSDEDGEYLATGTGFYNQLLKYNGLRVHSSAVVVDGKAYLFTANCGTGKSTHTSLWMDLFQENAYIINDDKPALRLENGIWYVYGTPWSGKLGINANKKAVLGGIAILERAEQNSIERIKTMDAILPILRQSTRPKERESREKVLELLDNLIGNVPIWKLKCNMDLESAKLSYSAMAGKMGDKHESRKNNCKNYSDNHADNADNGCM